MQYHQPSQQADSLRHTLHMNFESQRNGTQRYRSSNNRTLYAILAFLTAVPTLTCVRKRLLAADCLVEADLPPQPLSGLCNPVQ